MASSTGPAATVAIAGGTVDFHQPDMRGKLVRVTGVLRLERMPHAGFERQFPNYYCIEAESFEVIDQVSDPKVVLVSDG